MREVTDCKQEQCHTRGKTPKITLENLPELNPGDSHIDAKKRILEENVGHVCCLDHPRRTNRILYLTGERGREENIKYM